MARPRGDIAPRILHAARRRFLTEGIDGASLRGIAADAGTNIGMVYYYFPTKDEMADYMESYVARFALPVELNTRVERVWREGDTYVVTTGSRRFEATNVIVASGAHREPRVPAIARELVVPWSSATEYFGIGFLLFSRRTPQRRS